MMRGERKMKNLLRMAFLRGLPIRRMYYLLMAFTLIIPLVYGAFLLVTMMKAHTTFNDVLAAHPMYTVMFLVVLLDVLWGYLLFAVSSDLSSEEGRLYIYLLIFFIAVSQLIVGNFVIAILAGFMLINMDQHLSQAFRLLVMKKHGLYSGLAAGLLMMSLLCSFALIRLTYFV